MSNEPNNKDVNKLLVSQLKEETNLVLPTQAGEWTDLGFNYLNNIADQFNIDTSKINEDKLGQSIPSSWAVPLSFQLVLYDTKHTLHEQIFSKWAGMLAAIAFAAIKNYSLKIKEINLEDKPNFSKSLKELKPPDGESIYKLDNNQNPWLHLYVFLWKDQPVGITSPTTLVCPSREGNWETLPWFINGKLVFPTDNAITAHNLSDDDTKYLWLWLNKLKTTLNQNQIVGLLNKFQKELKVPDNETQILQTIETNRFGVQMTPEALKYLMPIAPGQELLPSNNNNHHQNYEASLANWKGMLAAIAFAKIKGFPLQVKPQTLTPEEATQINSFSELLINILPDDSNSIQANQNPYVFLWKDQPVGITSPTTLVCPSTQGNWEKLPWFTNGKLVSPVDSLTEGQKNKLCSWLNNLQAELTKLSNGNNRNTIQNISNLIDNFKQELKANQPNLKIQLIEFQGISSRNHNQSLQLLKPIAIEEQESSIRLIPSRNLQEGLGQLHIIPNSDGFTETKTIEEQWTKTPDEIRIYQQVHSGILQQNNWQQQIQEQNKNKNVEFKEAKDLFLDELFFIEFISENKDLKTPLPHALFLSKNEIKIKGDKKIAPLIPINPILLNYLTVADLQKRIRFEQEQDDKVKVTLTIPLSGVDEPKDYTITKEYELKEENKLATAPILEIFPNFISDTWKEYYCLECGLTDSKELQFNWSHIAKNENIIQFRPKPNINIQLVKLSQFPEYLICNNQSQNPLGFILLNQPKQPKQINNNRLTWIVGIDRGTSFTNVRIFEIIDQHQQTLQEIQDQNFGNLIYTVTAPNGEILEEVDQDTFLYEYFLPLVSSKSNDLPFPRATILTVKGSDKNDNDKNRQILDGRIYIPPAAVNFQFDQKWMKTNLKWDLTVSAQ